MKVSLFTQSLFALPLDEAISAAAAIGYPAIELACCSPHLSLETARTSADAVVRQVADAGLDISALSLFNTFTDPAKLEDEVVSAETYIRLAPLFGTSAIKLTPGAPGSSDATTEHWDTLAVAIERLVPLAEDMGVQLAFETHMRQLTDTLASSQRLLAMAPEPTVGLTVDFSNLSFAGEDMAEAVAMLGSRTINTHLKNGYVDDDGGWHFEALDQGWTDYPSVLELLRRAGYTGYLTIECLGPEAAKWPVEKAKADLEVLVTWLAELDSGDLE